MCINKTQEYIHIYQRTVYTVYNTDHKLQTVHLCTLILFIIIYVQVQVQSGDRIPVGAIFSAPVQTGPGAHPASCTMGTGSFPGVESGWGVMLTPHPF
jgi:hypothetical protein